MKPHHNKLTAAAPTECWNLNAGTEARIHRETAVHNSPGEVELHEVCDYRLSRPEGSAVQGVNQRAGGDQTFTARDGEAVLIPERPCGRGAQLLAG